MQIPKLCALCASARKQIYYLMQKAIGIFDSGIGGLTVLKEIVAALPDENIIYLGDTARVPYGIRSAETVTRYSFENTQFLLAQEIKMLVVACNTASAISLEAVKKEFPLPVIGVLEPGARAAVGETTKTGQDAAHRHRGDDRQRRL